MMRQLALLPLVVTVSLACMGPPSMHRHFVPSFRWCIADGWDELDGSASGAGIMRNLGEGREADCVYLLEFAADPDQRVIVVWSERTENLSSMENLHAARWSGERWEELGESASDRGLLGEGNRFNTVTLAFDDEGNPIVAWFDDQTVRIRGWNGAEWSEAISTSRCPYGTWGSDIILDEYGQPILVGVARPVVRDEHEVIFAIRWSGNEWITFGSPVPDDLPARQANVSNLQAAIDSQGRLIVGWTEDSAQIHGEIQTSRILLVRRWNGTGWENLGPSAEIAEGTSPLRYSIAIDSEDNPVVALNPWSPQCPEEAIVVLRWDGQNWLKLDEGLENLSGVRDAICMENPVLAIDSDGNPTVAWRNLPDYSQQLCIMEWESGHWNELGAGSASRRWGHTGILWRRGAVPGGPRICIDDMGSVWIAFDCWRIGEGRLYVLRRKRTE